jgi:hypothetical protein
MAIGKKLGLVTAVLVLCAGALQAQWRTEIAGLFVTARDYRAIAGRLLENYGTLGTLLDKSDASAILSFCYSKLGNSGEETRWMVEYFEINRQQDSGFTFLDLVSQADVIGFLNTWKSRYPFVSGISLVKGIGNQPIMPAGILPLVVEISHPALYRFMSGPDILEGGEFQAGFNVIALNANELFLDSSRRVYTLDIKSGGLTLKKEITLDIRVTSTMRPPQPAPKPGQVREYTLSLYIGGELVMTSKKTENQASLVMDIKPANLPYGFRPDWVLHRNEPNVMNSASIIQALALVYSLLKDLFKKRGTKDVEPPKIETVQSLDLTFHQKDGMGQDRETRVTIELLTKNLPYVLTVP